MTWPESRGVWVFITDNKYIRPCRPPVALARKACINKKLIKVNKIYINSGYCIRQIKKSK